MNNLVVLDIENDFFFPFVPDRKYHKITAYQKFTCIMGIDSYIFMM